MKAFDEQRSRHLQPNLSAPHNIEGYATKQWGGLERTQHAPRLRLFVERALADLPTRRLNLTAYLDSYAEFAVAWENTRWDPSELPDEPVGSPSQISTELLAKYAGGGWASCP